MTEQEMLVAMAKRLEANGSARQVEYPKDGIGGVLEFDCIRSLHSICTYPVRFVFDDSGTVVEVYGVA